MRNVKEKKATATFTQSYLPTNQWDMWLRAEVKRKWIATT